MLRLTKMQFLKILILYVLLALAAVLCYNIKELLPPAKKRPFRCSDESLAKPFVDDTVPPNQLYMLGVYFPIVLIIVGELMCDFAARKCLKNFSCILTCVLKSIIVLTLFLIGLAVERLYKNVAKVKMARLRPNFITVCEPVNMEGYTCQDLPDETVMDEYECSSDSYPSWAVDTAFASFPSGHTSLASYSMVFLICYLHLLSWKLQHVKTLLTLFILIMQSLCCCVIVFVGISRILDFRHHWSDVCAGFMSGSCIALVVNYYLKSQLANIEEWLSELTHRSVEDIESGQTACVNKNVCEKNETFAMELVS